MLIFGGMQVPGFFEALVDIDEYTPRWNALVAGLSTMRVVEAAADKAEIPSELLQVAANSLARVTDLPLRALLQSILNGAIASTTTSADDRLTAVGGRLLAYAKFLQNVAMWPPAADVAAASHAIAKQSRDHDLALQALSQQAYALRRALCFADAEAVYERMARYAEPIGDTLYLLEADLGRAKVAADRGDFPSADAQLQALVAKAQHHPGVLGRALVDAACVAGVRGDPAQVIRLGRQALGVLTEQRDRDVMHLNMATAFRETGERSAALNLAQRVARTAIEREKRWFALVLVMNLATDAHADRTFQEASAELAVAQLTPRIAAEYFEATARWCASTDRYHDANLAINRMLAVAEEYGLSELLIRADTAREDILRRRVPKIYRFRPVLPKRSAAHAVRVIAEEMERLCAVGPP